MTSEIHHLMMEEVTQNNRNYIMIKNLLASLFLMTLLFTTGCNTTQQPAEPEPTGVVIETTPEGKEVWRTDNYQHPSYFNKDKNGSHLVADLEVQRFFLVTKDGDIVLNIKANNPEYIEETAGGFILVNQAGTNNVEEIDKEGNVIWSMPDTPDLRQVKKLENGNYLIASRAEGVIKEIDKNKKVIWSTPKDLFKQPFSIQILPNDTYLVADFDNHRIVEVKKDGTIVWSSQAGLNHPKAALKLPNNTYVIADYDHSRVVFIDKEGLTLAEITGIQANNLALAANGNIYIAGKLIKQETTE